MPANRPDIIASRFDGFFAFSISGDSSGSFSEPEYAEPLRLLQVKAQRFFFDHHHTRIEHPEVSDSLLYGGSQTSQILFTTFYNEV